MGVTACATMDCMFGGYLSILHYTVAGLMGVAACCRPGLGCMMDVTACGNNALGTHSNCHSNLHYDSACMLGDACMHAMGSAITSFASMQHVVITCIARLACMVSVTRCCCTGLACMISISSLTIIRLMNHTSLFIMPTQRTAYQRTSITCIALARLIYCT